MRSNEMHEVRLLSRLRSHEVTQRDLGCFELPAAQPAPEEFVAQPYPIGVDHVGLTIVGNLLNTPAFATCA